MSRRLDHRKAEKLLRVQFDRVEQSYFTKEDPPSVSDQARTAADKLFDDTSPQSYREALLGCAVARMVDRQIDIRSPYVQQGSNAFSGRSLDEKVINPFLVSKKIPCSRGPYLAVFRRKVRFVPETAEGLKDKPAYEAFLRYLDELEQADVRGVLCLLRYLLYRFIDLRDKSSITVLRLERVSLEQIRRLNESLLSRQSGGLMPVLLVVALLKALREVYHLDWQIEWQDINVSDRAKGAGGDITIRDGGEARVVVEVTERVIDETRVDSTFQTKIAPLSIRDYLFAFANTDATAEAHRLAHRLFAQGHEVGFVRVGDWIYYNLATAGTQGRRAFLENLAKLVDQCSATVKVLWNEAVQKLLQGQM